MLLRYVLLIQALWGIIAPLAFAQTFPPSPSCDGNQSCLGNALTLARSTQAQYVDVRTTAANNMLSQALTFEAWLNPTRQSDVRQFIAGRWGPNADQHDVWVVYISEQNEIVCEINGAGTAMGAADNTIARASIAALYDSWFHLAAVFDGSTETVRIFLNGVQAAEARNTLFPASRLHIPANTSLQMQIGNTNALNNIGERNATYLGQMDEIRLWARALTANEIQCGQHSSLQGTENGLALYYRCNDAPSSVTLCDASGNGSAGDLRSGARCLAAQPERITPQILTAQPASIVETFSCDAVRTYTVDIRNISAALACTDHVSVSISGRDASQFSLVSASRFPLPAGASTQASVRLQTNLTGELSASLSVARANRCGDTLRIPILLTRSTLLQSSVRSITFATLYAGCRETSFVETSFSLRNTGTTPITLQSLANARTSTFQPVAGAFPQTLAPNASQQIMMRFLAADSASIINDTLRIRTNDACQAELAIPMRGVIEEAIIIRRGYGRARLDSLAFGRECPAGGISDPVEFTYESAASTATIRIDTIIYPSFIRGRAVRYPVLLTPGGAFAEPNFLRFAPLQEGFVRDSVLIRASIVGAAGGTQAGNSQAQGCTFEKKIYVSGRGNAIETRISPGMLDIGDVIVGQQGVASLSLSNPSSEDTLRASVYMRMGNVFSLVGAQGLTLLPGETRTIPIQFRPTSEGLFADEVCIFEQRCFFTTCASVQGRGIQQIFRFDSVLTRIDNVPGCSFKVDSVVITNLTNADQILTNLEFIDPSGRFEEFSGLRSQSVVSIAIRANSSETFLFRYTPNDLQRDRSDVAILRFRSSGQLFEILIRGTSLAPKLFVTPLTVFGVVEIGDTKHDTLIVENLTNEPLRLDSLTLPDGYRIHTLPRPLPTALNPREVFRVPIVFAPTADRTYNGNVRAVSQTPCPTSIEGALRGRGQTLTFDIPTLLVNFGFTRPCDCALRNVPIQNPSFVNPMTIRAITIDSVGIPGGVPYLFSWTSLLSLSGRTPYTIPPNTSDTLRLLYCPRTPAEDRFTTSQARLLVHAEGAGWQQSEEIFLAGRRALLFRPTPSRIAFTPTLINTDNAMPQTVTLDIPGVLRNPSPEPIVIDSVSFSRHGDVFRILSPTFPIRLEAGQTAQIRLGFRPTATGIFEARLQMHQSLPCWDMDTTVFVSGIGFDGNPSGMTMAFSNHFGQALDTFRLSTCGTFIAPVFAYSRASLAAPLLITAHLRFDTTMLRIITITPQRATQASITSLRSDGAAIRIATPRLDSLHALALVEFASRSQRRSVVQMDLDSITVLNEDSSPSMLFPTRGFARVLIEETSLDAEQPPLVDFDSVQVLDCRRRDFVVHNTGDLAVQALSLVNLPTGIRLVASAPPLQNVLPPGAELRLSVEYCPQNEERINTRVGIHSQTPCEASTSAIFTGRGVLTEIAPRFYLTTATLGTPSIRGRIADTLVIPLTLDRDIAATINGRAHWLRNFSFRVSLQYSPFSLKFIGAQIAVPTGNMTPTVNLADGTLDCDFRGMDSLREGTIALLRFVVPVPDTLLSELRVTSDSTSFRTDSLMFLRIRPQPTTALFTTEGICDLTLLRFPDGNNKHRAELYRNSPNPVSDKTSIEFEIAETMPIRLALYSAQGTLMQTLLDGTQTLLSGRYHVEIQTMSLASGVYFYVLEGKGFMLSKAMVVVR